MSTMTELARVVLQSVAAKPAQHRRNRRDRPLMPPSTDAAECADDLVNLLNRESHLAVVHSGLVLCREQ